MITLFYLCNGNSYTFKTMFNSSSQDEMPTILAGDIFKCIFLNENNSIPISISL